ncbi:MAG: hypothetical protein WB507_01535 [Solirubrobacterales bacterium]
MAAKHHPARSRELHVDAEVAAFLPAAALAQLEAAVMDPDNPCCACGKTIQGPVAEAVLFRDTPLSLLQLAHPDCMRSGLYPAFGSGGAALACQSDFELATVLALRPARPRAVLFLEPLTLVCAEGEDPLESWALKRGLSPVSGAIERIAAPPTDAFTVCRRPDGLLLPHRRSGFDMVCAPPDEVEEWWDAAQGEALVVTARGLGLRRAERAIEEAVRLRPAWAAVATLENFASRPRMRGAAGRFARKLLQPSPR